MYGTNLQLIVLRCDVCRMWVALRVDRDDLRRHYIDGVFVQHAFVTADGKPYLSAADRELILGVCDSCWKCLCPDPTVYWRFYN
jgi:hypothetical protein